MEKIILNGILVDSQTNFRKVILDINKNNLDIIKFNNDKFLVPSLELYFNLNCVKKVYFKKISQVLLMLGLKGKKLSDFPLSYSNSDKYKLLLATALINNSSCLLLVFPNLYLDDCNMNLILNVLKKLSKEYNKNIYIVSNQIDFLYRECDNLIIYKKNNILFNSNRNNLYEKKDLLLSNGYCLPPILNFIFETETMKKVKLSPTFDIKELMKDIYRNV